MNQDLLCYVLVSWEIIGSLLMYIREFSIGKIKFIVKYIFVMTLVGDGDSMVCTAYAHLEPAAISRIAHLEDELGVVLLAHEKPTPVAPLSEADLMQIQEIEKKMGIRLVAYA